jgi:DNA-binding response OmpR family regulator
MPTTNSAQKKIVMVEDDKFLGGLVAKKLVAAHYDVTLLDKGEKAAETVAEIMPDAIILDLLLPDMSGFDILRQIKKNDKTKNIPVMVLSNLGEQTDIQQAQDLGANSFLIKASVNVDEIAYKISRVIAGVK